MMSPVIPMERLEPPGTQTELKENVKVVPESATDGEAMTGPLVVTVPTAGVPPVPGGTVMMTAVRLLFDEV